MSYDLRPAPSTSPTRTARARTSAAIRGVRRRVLVHRRLVAALLVGVSVLCALRVLQPPAPATELVWVAAADLASGSTLSGSDLTRARVAPSAVPAGLLPRDRLVGSQVAGPMRRGEVLTDRRVLGPPLLDDRPGTVAVPVRLADPAVAGLLRVGDRIDLLRVDPDAAPTADDSDAPLAEAAEVLAVPRSATSAALSPLGGTASTTSADTAGLVVLAVPEEVAADVSAAGLDGFLAVTLSR